MSFPCLYPCFFFITGKSHERRRKLQISGTWSEAVSEERRENSVKKSELQIWEAFTNLAVHQRRRSGFVHEEGRRGKEDERLKAREG
ncbi:hypothetical protein HID58_045784 [Brassica napus]|uniref:Uncharacterized protein n=1 Tax=Brassica napus TaxID=3708 RepID=A0ABQ8AUJ1_BRANA|nr:hypothetical protein HID58_045784 [Brassica napus]